MSLTSQIRNVDSRESRFFRTQFPNVSAVGKQWRQHLVGAETILPSQTSESVPWTVIGQALDYRIRYYFAITPVHQLVAAEGMRMLNVESFVDEDGHLIDPPSLWAWGYGDETLEEGGNLKLSGLAYAFSMSLEALLEEAQPADRRLPLELEERLCRHCYVLALFEHIYRGDRDFASPLGSLKRGATEVDLLALADPSSVDDLRRLSWNFHDRCSHLITPQAVLNPTFEGSVHVGGADADLIVDGCLIDIKATISPKFDGRLLYQLLGYVLLDYSDRFHIRSVGVYLARQGVLVQMPLDEFLATLSGSSDLQLSELRESFRTVTKAPSA